MAFWAEDQGACCLIPLVRRHLPAFLKAPAAWTDACSPYGYPSPLLAGEPARRLDHFLPAFRELCGQSGIVSIFLRLHPLLPLSLERAADFGRLVQHGDTVFIDLLQSSEEIWRQTRKNHRTDINKLLRTGFEALINDWSLARDFKRVYRQTMQRVGATDYYQFSDAYFDGLKEALSEKLNLCSVLSPTGEVAAAGLFTTCKGIVEFHLAGTEEKYLSHAPTKLMFDFVRRWGKDLGSEVFHLGGGVGGEIDPLYHFKAGFSKFRSPFFTLRLVQDAQGYQELCSRARGGVATGSAGGEDFFPCYRKGIRVS
ncbi:GNAT family N-acetyltransferase [Desulfuromonas versatilis]|nr:GNAT family N-acetyltransferase [Desulfuromonas versatilis]